MAVIMKASLSYTSLVWVSRIDGSRMHEIGCTPLKMLEELGIVDMNDVPEFIEWQPDGKRLSFLLKNTLYTVPAD